jgi:hypothetical protein
LAFLDETVAHFSTNKRGVSPNGICCYTAGCAIGRHLHCDLRAELDGMDISSVASNQVFEKLPENLRELGQSFLWDVQGFHDAARFWFDDGLTTEGKNQYNYIKLRVENDLY